jgi:integrase
MKGCRPLTDEEVAMVLESLPGKMAARNRALFLLGVKSGFRISEMLSLRLGAVVQFGVVVERVTVERRSMKKRLEGRTVLLHPAARQALAEWIQQMARQGYMRAETPVFLSRRNPTKPVSRVWAYRFLTKTFRACKLAGKLGTHSMRKTFADRVYAHLNGDLAKTQLALGHRNINSTVSYLSFRQEEVDQAILSI